MATIVTKQDFNGGSTNIPNLDLVGQNLTLNYIEKYEPKFLKELLGNDLYELFKVGLPQGTVGTTASSPTVTGTGTLFTSMFEVGDTITIDGETHTIDTITSNTLLTTVQDWAQTNVNADYYGEQRYIDLIPYLKPAIIDYVYYFYVEDNGGNLLLGAGAGNPKKQNAQTVSAWPMMVKAWNEMVGYNKETNKFLDDNKTTYPEYTSPLPRWYFWEGIYQIFDWNWYSWYGCYEIPSIYRVKNGLGL